MFYKKNFIKSLQVNVHYLHPPAPQAPESPFHLKTIHVDRKNRLIHPIFHTSFKSGQDFDPYISFIEETIKKTLPLHLLIDILQISNEEQTRKAFARLNAFLPLFVWSESEGNGYAICVNLLCVANFSHGVGRYISDTLSRWLLPGKFLNVCSVQSLNFKFTAFDQQNYYIHQAILETDDAKEYALIKTNLEDVIRFMRLGILSVKHARNVITLKKLTPQEKKALIQENISSILDRPSKEFDLNVFDQMHHFLLKISAEDKIMQIKDKFTSFLEQKPNVFNYDIFYEIQHFVLLFHDKFTAPRDIYHVSRLIAFQYLFRKSLISQTATEPNERYLSLKFLRTKIHTSTESKNVVGILVGINVLSEHDLFGERHLVESLQQCVRKVRKVKDSFLVDRRAHDKIRLFYIEIEKEDGSFFSLEEMRTLRRRIPHELKTRFEHVIHPIFMPRNEEEVMRNIVLLSQELRYVHDIPQVIITFDTQTKDELSFTVILLRLLDNKKASFEEILQKNSAGFRFENCESKIVGKLRHKYQKEANVFSIKLPKTRFLRKDYSLDLFKARQAVSTMLSHLFGEIRDFNGGMLSKENEVFHELKELAASRDSATHFLLENFF